MTAEHYLIYSSDHNYFYYLVDKGVVFYYLLRGKYMLGLEAAGGQHKFRKEVNIMRRNFSRLKEILDSIGRILLPIIICLISSGTIIIIFNSKKPH